MAEYEKHNAFETESPESASLDRVNLNNNLTAKYAAHHPEK